MNIIAAVDKKWGLGYRNELLFQLEPDLRNFRRMTLGNIVIMGRNTFESLPDKKPLPDRINIVLSGDRNWTAEGAHVCRSLSELYDLIISNGCQEDSLPDNHYSGRECFVIGGAEIFRLLLPCCEFAYLTVIDESREADRFFPDLTGFPEWYIFNKSSGGRGFDRLRCKMVDYSFVTYKNLRPIVLSEMI